MDNFEKYIVNPFDSEDPEWVYDEFQRLSDYIWKLTDEINERLKALEAKP